MNRSATFLLSQYVWELLGGSLAQLTSRPAEAPAARPKAMKRLIFTVLDSRFQEPPEALP